MTSTLDENRNRYDIREKFIAIVGSSLYQHGCEDKGVSIDHPDEWLWRYINDDRFKARIDVLVAQLLLSLDEVSK